MASLNVRYYPDWGVWNNIYGVVYDKHQPLRLKPQLYSTHCNAVWCRSMGDKKDDRFNAYRCFEMRHLCATRGVAWRERFQHGSIRMEVQVRDAADKIWEM
ncbi:hypothetical protein KIL84_007033 [Mauremys mutica]|uniref:Uncharacterized protein n=1 Tax=Mauremys mutica TaxID=74926 RepID=A0A9D3X2C4_9SAUR|nr:hypothetical protein KIL84_007033 [Mauremys mutica]